MKGLFFKRTKKEMKYDSVSHSPEMHSGNFKEQNMRCIYLEPFRTDLYEDRKLS